MKKVDFIIVGQGLAGSVLAYLLQKQGQKVVIFDKFTEGGKLSSSQIAAGVINPITGMRFVKTWRIDAFLAAAKALYLDIETDLGIKLWHERSIFRALRTIEEQNNWLLRSSFPDYQPYCGETAPSVKSINQFKSVIEIKNAAQVNLPALVAHFRHTFKTNNILLTDNFDTAKLDISTDKIIYKDVHASKIIFCEGIGGAKNPFFKHLPFNPDKGELLLVKIPNLDLSQIFKNKMTIVPLHDTEGGNKDLYWVGATNVWTFDNDLPNEATKELIINELKNTISIPFEVVAHQAAIRPTVKDRRPFIGCASQQYPNIYIFNGFGTKGASLVPFWASHFVGHLLHHTPIDKEVDVKRFG